MKLPPDALIARSKVTHYLLGPRSIGDKSRFLALAGYDLSQADRPMHDLCVQVLPCDAEEPAR